MSARDNALLMELYKAVRPFMPQVEKNADKPDCRGRIRDASARGQGVQDSRRLLEVWRAVDAAVQLGGIPQPRARGRNVQSVSIEHQPGRTHHITAPGARGQTVMRASPGYDDIRLKLEMAFEAYSHLEEFGDLLHENGWGEVLPRRMNRVPTPESKL